MPLYLVPGDRLIDPKKVEKKPVVGKILRATHRASLDRLFKTYEEGLAYVLNNGGRVAWTKTGALFGHKSSLPHKDIEHLWFTVTSSVGDGRLCYQGVGTLLQLMISKRPETWLCNLVETGHVDPLDGTDIYAYQYWVDEGYIPPEEPLPTVALLSKKWGAKFKN